MPGFVSILEGEEEVSHLESLLPFITGSFLYPTAYQGVYPTSSLSEI